MKSNSGSWCRSLIVMWAALSFEGVQFVRAQQAPPPAPPQQNPSAAQSSAAQTPTAQTAQQPAAPPENPAPPPSEAPKRSQDDLQKLVAPIALYPDPLIASILPASAYPLEIVQAARFVKDTNNIAKLDEQSWDDNVKAVARIPDVIKQMDDNINWTSDLGDAFISQPKELMDAIQTMRTKAQDSGALKTTPQQTVSTEPEIVTNYVQQEPVYVTNEVVQIQPSQPDVVYVPQYNPTVVYPSYPVAYPGYVSPYYPGAIAGAALTFGAGMAMGAWLGNGCDWGHGGCWGGNYHNDVNINNNFNRNVNYNNRNNANFNGNNINNANRQKWQPNQNRLNNSGASLNGSQNRAARGYGTGTGAGANRANAVSAANRTAASTTAANRASTGNFQNRAGTGTAAMRARV